MTNMTLDLQKMGLVTLNESEVIDVFGGDGDGLIFPMGTAGGDPAQAGAATISVVRAAAEIKGIVDLGKWLFSLL